MAIMARLACGFEIGPVEEQRHIALVGLDMVGDGGRHDKALCFASGAQRVACELRFTGF
jgi:hypothetical protein